MRSSITIMYAIVHVVVQKSTLLERSREIWQASGLILS